MAMAKVENNSSFFFLPNTSNLSYGDTTTETVYENDRPLVRTMSGFSCPSPISMVKFGVAHGDC